MLLIALCAGWQEYLHMLEEAKKRDHRVVGLAQRPLLLSSPQVP